MAPSGALGYLLDIQRVRQYFDHATRTRAVLGAVRADVGFVGQVRRGLLPLPTDRAREPVDPFPTFRRRPVPNLAGRRVGVVATGGSGALASLLGVVRVLEEGDVEPSAYCVCSGSALFGVPLAAGLATADVARWVQTLRPADYLDPNWAGLAALPLRLGRGWAGLLRGERIERCVTDLLGNVRLGELPIPVWSPVWNVEENRLTYVGPDTHPDLTAARLVRMSVALPLAVEPVRFDGGWWLDGGVVDILPAQPLLDEDRCDVAVVVNGFYPHEFGAEGAVGWRDRRWSVLHLAEQTRTMQHLALARRALAELRDTVDVVLLEPVPSDRVAGARLYAQFLDSREWPTFMRAGYDAARAALRASPPE